MGEQYRITDSPKFTSVGDRKPSRDKNLWIGLAGLWLGSLAMLLNNRTGLFPILPKFLGRAMLLAAVVMLLTSLYLLRYRSRRTKNKLD